jgi:hypothetical protein
MLQAGAPLVSQPPTPIGRASAGDLISVRAYLANSQNKS